MRTAACQAVTITAISSTQATQHGSRAPREAPRNSSQCVHHSVMNKHTLQTLTFRPLYGPCVKPFDEVLVYQVKTVEHTSRKSAS